MTTPSVFVLAAQFYFFSKKTKLRKAPVCEPASTLSTHRFDVILHAGFLGGARPDDIAMHPAKLLQCSHNTVAWISRDQTEPALLCSSFRSH
jgi:hypothetical protein